MTQYEVNVRPSDGNAFSILGAVRKALKELERGGHAPAGTAERYVEEATAGDYDHLLRTSLKYVHIVPE